MVYQIIYQKFHTFLSKMKLPKIFPYLPLFLTHPVYKLNNPLKITIFKS